MTQAIEYTDPGYLVYSDVLPVQLAAGRRYLASARVQRLVGPGRRGRCRSRDGLSAAVAGRSCRPAR